MRINHRRYWDEEEIEARDRARSTRSIAAVSP
jgi:hypothetical protein